MGNPLSLMKGQFRNRKGGFSVATSFEGAIKCWHMDRCTLHRHRPKACYVHVSRTMINHKYFDSLYPAFMVKFGMVYYCLTNIIYILHVIMLSISTGVLFAYLMW